MLYFTCVLVYIFYPISATTVAFKESSYVVKEDDGMFTVTVQKFGETTADVTVLIRTRASNPTSATRTYVHNCLNCI